LRVNLKNFNKGKDFKLSLSVGKAIYDYKDPITTDMLLSIAEKAMYKEKLKKKNLTLLIPYSGIKYI
jgi:GGDEF domain-containing protein